LIRPTGLWLGISTRRVTFVQFALRVPCRLAVSLRTPTHPSSTTRKPLFIAPNTPILHNEKKPNHWLNRKREREKKDHRQIRRVQAAKNTAGRKPGYRVRQRAVG